MPAMALSRVGARVVESGPDGGQDLAVGAWQRLEALPDPRSLRGRIYPLACLVAIAVCAFTAAGNDIGQPVADRLYSRRVAGGGEPVVQGGEADPGLGRLPPGVLVAVDAQPGRVGEIGAELDEERAEVVIDAVEVVVVDDAGGG